MFKEYKDVNLKKIKDFNNRDYLYHLLPWACNYENKDFYINSLTKKEEIYGKKLLDLNKLKELEAKGMRRIVVENSIVTSSAE